MAKIISIHSFRGGTGKSNSTANFAALLAQEGYRVGVVDTDIQSPGIHVLFGLKEDEMSPTLNDYLWDQCDIEDAAHDVTANLGVSVKGKIFLVPASIKANEIIRVLSEGYDVGLLTDGFHDLIDALKLDYLVVDTHPGLNNDTLISVAVSDVMIIVLRPDRQDFQGTGVTVDVARKLNVPRLLLLLNKMPTAFDFEQVRRTVEETYNTEVAGVLPHSDEMMVLQSAGVFVVHHPKHPLSQEFKRMVAKVIAG